MIVFQTPRKEWPASDLDPGLATRPGQQTPWEGRCWCRLDLGPSSRCHGNSVALMEMAALREGG